LPRRCQACQTVIDDDLLIGCPNPQCPSRFSGTAQTLLLTKDQIDQLADQLRGPVTWRILKNGWTWAGFFSLLLAILGTSYVTIRSKVEGIVTSQIEQRFAEPRIRETFQEVAENQASKMLRDEIQPAVDRFRADLQKEYQTVAEEVARVKLLNSLPILADKAILEYDRGALNELNRIAQTDTEMNPLKRAAIAEIKRVEIGYTGGFGGLPDRIQFLPSLTVISEDGTVKVDGDIPTSRLMMSLSDLDWRVRAKAASLLGVRKEKGVPDILLNVMRTDIYLGVVANASQSFRFLAGLYEPGNIDVVDNLKKWLKERSIDQSYELSNINIARLKQWWKEIIIAQLHELGRLNIDGHEQWWQEHSPEVNERLAPAESQ
jgi:hypothetical protein